MRSRIPGKTAHDHAVRLLGLLDQRYVIQGDGPLEQGIFRARVLGRRLDEFIERGDRALPLARRQPERGDPVDGLYPVAPRLYGRIGADRPFPVPDPLGEHADSKLNLAGPFVAWIPVHERLIGGDGLSRPIVTTKRLGEQITHDRSRFAVACCFQVGPEGVNRRLVKAILEGVQAEFEMRLRGFLELRPNQGCRREGGPRQNERRDNEETTPHREAPTGCYR